MVGSLALCASISGLSTRNTAVAAAPESLAAKVDRRMQVEWLQAGIVPAPVADDAVFLRRVYLDLIGRVPTVAEARSFLDHSSQTRSELIAALVARPAHARHMAAFWRRVWVPQTETPQYAGLAAAFERWLSERLARRKAYDEIVRELIAAEAAHPKWLARRDRDEAAGNTFLVVGDFQPESMAANAVRAFLGINLECAQCHDHPFARWSREEFFGTAAFFTRPLEDRVESAARFALAIPDTSDVVTARLLTCEQPDWPAVVDRESGRRLFAEWVVSPQNPYFARNAVNRLWAWFFGRGLVEPLDDLSDEGLPQPPDLLGELAAAFAESRFDLRYLASALTLTRAYQLSSAADAGAAAVFAGAKPRGLTGEQLYDSLATAAGRASHEREDDDAARRRRRFAEHFKVERPANAERSISQALALMNGSEAGRGTDADEVPMLQAVAGAPFLDARGRLEVLFMATLSRSPRDDELRYLLPYLDENDPIEMQRLRALADVFWALCNSSEFNTNH